MLKALRDAAVSVLGSSGLGKLAQPLKDAGLDRVNISIDTLDPQKFRQVTRGGKLEMVWEGIEAAEIGRAHV